MAKDGRIVLCRGRGLCSVFLSGKKLNRIVEVGRSSLRGEGRADRVVLGKRVVLGLLVWEEG